MGLGCLSLLPTVQAADPDPTVLDPISFGSVVQVLAGLAIVLAVFAVAVFLLKRLGRIRSLGAGGMRVVDSLSLGTRDRIVMVQIGDVQLLLGVTPGAIRSLHVFDQPVLLSEPGDGETFASHLKESLFKRQNAAGERP
jgi:flagellar protein FliO/FliZ